MKARTEPIVNRLRQLTDHIHEANEHAYVHHLREFCNYCKNTPALQCVLSQLPEATYDWPTQWHMIDWPLGDQGCAFRWSVLEQLADAGGGAVQLLVGIGGTPENGRMVFAQEVVTPLFDYLVHTLEVSSTTLYLLLRYKRWVEWFEAKRLLQEYKDSEQRGEAVLDDDLRRFLFESGIDYPLSQPLSPGGRADVIAGLGTDDPLVLEIKVWDSKKGYGEDRVRDGLRQAMDYAEKYGKDSGYVAVFNLDTDPLVFEGEADSGWPARLEVGDRTFFFLSVDIAVPSGPVSQRDRGRRVQVNSVRLADLLEGEAEG